MKEIQTILPEQFPPLLKHITDPPKYLFVQGNLGPLFDSSYKILCVVGSRRYTHYGKEVVHKLVSGLRGYNICIVSGLALGIDSIAHRAALDAELYTIAFPGSGLHEEVLYPPAHKRLAKEILESRGALLSEFELDQRGAPWTFPARNRLMAGISHATLVVECDLKSGTLITSARATDYNRDVAAVPGSIFSSRSAGPHMLISKGATPITSSDDLLEFLGFARRDGQMKLPLGQDPRFHILGEIEKKVVRFLDRGAVNRDTLLHEMEMDSRELNRVLTNLELANFIKEEAGILKLN